MIVPLKDVSIVAHVNGVVATIEIQLKYQNLENNPIECTYEFPLEKQTLFTDFKATIEDKTIETIVTDKDEAKQIYA